MTKLEKLARRASAMPKVAVGTLAQFTMWHEVRQAELIPADQRFDSKWSAWHKEVLSRPATAREV